MSVMGGTLTVVAEIRPDTSSLRTDSCPPQRSLRRLGCRAPRSRGRGFCLDRSLRSEHAADLRYRPRQSAVNANRSKRSCFGRCPHSQCLGLSPQMVSCACGIHMCSPLDVKRLEAWPVVEMRFMLMLCCGILLLLIHLSPHLKSTVAANPDFVTIGPKK